MADATDILSAVSNVLTGLYPATPVKVSKQRAADGRHMEAGWQEGFSSAAFVLSCREAEDIDRAFQSFTHLNVGYAVTVEYIKPAFQVVVNAPNGGATTVVEDPDVRTVRQALRAALFKVPLPGAATVFHVKYKTGRVYERMADGGPKYVVCAQTFTFYTSEPRPRA